MIAQWLLVAALLCVGLYAVSQWRTVPAVSFAMMVIVAVGLVVVLAPETANKAAHFLGIGRGADLIVYAFILAMLAAVFNIHLRLRSYHRQMTILSREIAINSARTPEAP